MIIVFGSINLDLIARVPRLPDPGETIAGESFATLPGGKGANQALAARRAGAKVAMAGAVGNDPFAADALSGLVAAGVDLAWTRRVVTPTGVALIHVDASGQNAITVVAGANIEARAATVPDAALVPGTTLLMQLEVPVGAVFDLATRAKRGGARVILNAAPATELPAGLIAAVDVLIVNAIEAATLAAELGMPSAPEAFVAAMHAHSRMAALVTLGARGALAAADGTLFTIAAPAVDVVDTTGAGDAFAGVLAAALDRGAGWPEAITQATAAGSLACTARGAQAALPERAAIQDAATRAALTLASRPLR
jgi:ribokinase